MASEHLSDIMDFYDIEVDAFALRWGWLSDPVVAGDLTGEAAQCDRGADIQA
jgi:hypothetical protein